MKDIHIAVVIFRSRTGQIDRNVDRMLPWVRYARKRGAAIVCFPEMNITGYGLDERVHLIAQSNPGRITRRLQDMAKTEDVVILAGMAERDHNGRIFISHLVVEPDSECGGPLKTYRKTHLSPPEQGLYTRGDSIALFTMRGLCFGIQLCYDAHFPELASRMAVNGADVLFMPHASPRGTPGEKYQSWMRHLTARAFDNGLYVLACNAVGSSDTGLEFPGIAVGIGPSGRVAKKNLAGEEGILMLELKQEELERIRGHRMRYFLPNRRERLYSRPNRQAS